MNLVAHFAVLIKCLRVALFWIERISKFCDRKLETECELHGAQTQLEGAEQVNARLHADHAAATCRSDLLERELYCALRAYDAARTRQAELQQAYARAMSSLERRRDVHERVS